MNSKIVTPEGVNVSDIEFTEIDIKRFQFEIDSGFKIVSIIKMVTNNEKAPTEITYKAFDTYQRLNQSNIDTRKKHISILKARLARMRAKQTVEFSFNKDKKDEKKPEEKTNKKDS